MAFRLETDRLVLRELEHSDLDALAEVLGDPVSMRYYPAPFSREKTRQWIESARARYAGDGFALWAIESKDTGEFLGDCGPVARVVDGAQEVEVGWHVARRHQRRGIATEAARECCRYAFEELGLTRLISLIRPENVPSRRVAEKLGMTVEKEIEYAGFPHYVFVLLSGA
ncbi:MAG TPA: GNAT family N-acetyltransferase [Actinomycetota bacterium]|nr:GNAT family N-acetyltransferase [Actinomycetota bacterium]